MIATCPEVVDQVFAVPLALSQLRGGKATSASSLGLPGKTRGFGCSELPRPETWPRRHPSEQPWCKGRYLTWRPGLAFCMSFASCPAFQSRFWAAERWAVWLQRLCATARSLPSWLEVFPWLLVLDIAFCEGQFKGGFLTASCNQRFASLGNQALRLNSAQRPASFESCELSLGSWGVRVGVSWLFWMGSSGLRVGFSWLERATWPPLKPRGVDPLARRPDGQQPRQSCLRRRERRGSRKRRGSRGQ